MKRLAYTLLALAVAGVALLNMNSCANTTAAPTGGDKDTLPPVLLGTVPELNALNFPLTGGKVELKFDEYTQVKTPGEIYVSPPQKKKATAKMKGKSVVVTFNDTLQPNRTYTIDFGNGLADNNEGNLFNRYVYTFSTGETIDSMYITGMAMDAEKLLPLKGVLIAVYDSLDGVKDPRTVTRDSIRTVRDSLLAATDTTAADRLKPLLDSMNKIAPRFIPYDSLLFLRMPYMATRTDDWGFFTLRNIPPKNFRIYAIEDLNSNSLFDPETERIGFLSDFFVPDQVMRDSIPELLFYDMKDTVGCNARVPMYNIMLYKEETGRQKVRSFGRLAKRECYIRFQSPHPVIDTLYFSGIKDKYVLKHFNKEGDSLSMWITDKGYLPDTLFAHIKYMKTDSTGNLSLQTEDFKMAVDKSLQKKDKNGKAVKDTSVTMTITAQPELVEQEGYAFEFGFPLSDESGFDKLRHFKITPRGDTLDIKYEIEKDTLNPKRYVLHPKEKFEKGHSYNIVARKGIFKDINDLPNDSTAVKVELPTGEDLCLLQLILHNVSGRYIVDLVNDKRDKVFRSYVVNEDKTLDFPYLKAGIYSVRITEDRNGNGLIDSGVLLENKQPEKVLMYDFGNKVYTLDIKERTDYEQEIDINQMFR